MGKSVRLFVILCALCTCAPLTTLAIAANNAAGASNSDQSNGAKNDTVRPLFDLASTTGSPFPSDRFTVVDLSQNTGLRVNLSPAPTTDECNDRNASSEMVEICLLNQLDGFNIRPRISIPFSGPIDLKTVKSENIFIISLGDTLVDGRPPDYKAMAEADSETEDIQVPADAGAVIGITQGVWDADPDTGRYRLYVEADGFLDQHTRYALIVTRGVHDASGRPIQQADVFNRLRGDDKNASDPEVRAYSQALKLGLAAALQVKGVHRDDVAVATVFSTMSSTAVLEKVRDQVMSLPMPPPADFMIGVDTHGNTARAAFDLSTITELTFNQQLTTALALTSTKIGAANLPLLRLIPGAISKLAYGRFKSPNYLHADTSMEPIATFSGVPTQVADRNGDLFSDVYFNVLLPSGTKPANGWPVILYGHGGAENMNGSPFKVAADFASHGFATLSFNQVGFGTGPLSALTVMNGVGTSVNSVTFLFGGRAYDLDGNKIYDVGEGSGWTGHKRILFSREANRQNVADVVQLIRVLQAGIDVDGDGMPDLDGSRVYYTGLSLGANLGMLLAAVEPRIQATVLSSVDGWYRPELVPGTRGGAVAGPGRVFQCFGKSSPQNGGMAALGCSGWCAPSD